MKSDVDLTPPQFWSLQTSQVSIQHMLVLGGFNHFTEKGSRWPRSKKKVSNISEHRSLSFPLSLHRTVFPLQCSGKNFKTQPENQSNFPDLWTKEADLLHLLFNTQD